jgi:S-methylmethionine-dependent homocysteine/selenocysteine methylase
MPTPSRDVASTPRHRTALPQLGERLFIADGGLETTLLFHEGIHLPCFAAFDLLKDAPGRATLVAYFERYAAIARDGGVGIVMETPTWRASRDWGAQMGYDEAALARVNREAVALVDDVRARFETEATPIVVSGNLGPRGDGYRADARMTADEARRYHDAQVASLADTAADMVAAFTMTYAEEAIGIVRAARAHAMPVAISFTLETDGRLPCGTTLAQAIAATDAATDGYAAYYMINCAHPSHFERVLTEGGSWRERLRGLRANASRKSHAELDAATQLDDGDPAELALDYRVVRGLLPGLRVVGGCCGTDHRHVAAICHELGQP